MSFFPSNSPITSPLILSKSSFLQTYSSGPKEALKISYPYLSMPQPPIVEIWPQRPLILEILKQFDMGHCRRLVGFIRPFDFCELDIEGKREFEKKSPLAGPKPSR